MPDTANNTNKGQHMQQKEDKSKKEVEKRTRKKKPQKEPDEDKDKTHQEEEHHHQQQNNPLPSMALTNILVKRKGIFSGYLSRCIATSKQSPKSM